MAVDTRRGESGRTGGHGPGAAIGKRSASSSSPFPTRHLARRLAPVLTLLAAMLSAAGPAAAQEDLAEQEERALKAAVAAVAPSVVRIETLGGLEKVGDVLVGTGPTTGLIVGEDGYVISSAFNFVQQPSSILVTLNNGKRLAAQIVARDHSRMLVLLKVNSPDRLPVPVATPREEMAPGQWSIALGRTFDSPEPNISAGILSATSRIWSKAIQTDAKISPSNYGGPLIDIRGRVFGVLVPLSAQGHGEKPELAGAELYDSGIGFAVPLVDILPRLDRLKQGQDLHPGLLGVAMKGDNVVSDPAIIAHVQVKSPASNAGLKADDKIVELGGSPVERLAQLRHALGRYYAGEKVKIAVLRGQERLERELELVAKVDPYVHPFVGLLPTRGPSAEPGVGVRWVYPASGAEAAGVKAGDRILAIAGKPVADATALRDAVAAYDPGAKIPLQVRRGAETLDLETTTGTLPTAAPASLPPGRPTVEPVADRPPVGVVPVKLPEEATECVAYVPENYHPSVPHALVVTLHSPNEFNQEALVKRWKPFCEREGAIVLAPKSSDPKRWQPTDAEFIRKTIDDVVSRYAIDRSRIVVHGYQAGGAMAYLVAFGQRDVIRGAIVVDAAPPGRSQAPENDPIQRLAIYSATVEKSRGAAAQEAAAKRLSELKFPVTAKKLDAERDLNEADLAEVARWIDTLDRI